MTIPGQNRAVKCVIRCASFMIALAVVLALSPLYASEESPRRFEVADLFRIERLGQLFGGPYSIDRSGRLAVTRTRAMGPADAYEWSGSADSAAGEIWVEDHTSSKLRQLTDGHIDGTGWWAPSWSPDGRLLAMLSTRGGSATVWLWDSVSGKLSQLTEESVDLPRGVNVVSRPFEWVDNHTLLVPLLRDATPNLVKLGPRPSRARAPHDDLPAELTASALNSIAAEWRRDLNVSLALIDSETGERFTIAEGRTLNWRIAPSRSAIAFARQIGAFKPSGGSRLLIAQDGIFTVDIVSLAASDPKVFNTRSTGVLPTSIRWSPDGSQVAYLSYKAADQNGAELNISGPSQLLPKIITLEGLDLRPSQQNFILAQLEWLQNNMFLVRAARSGPTAPNFDTRRDWWIVGASRRPTAVTSAMKSVPSEFWPGPGRRFYFGFSGGAIWRLHPLEQRLENLTLALPVPVRDLAWPRIDWTGSREQLGPDEEYTTALFVSAGDAGNVVLALNLESGKIEPLPPAPAGFELSAYHPPSQSALFKRTDRNGTILARSSRSGANFKNLLVMNGFLSGIAEGEIKSFQYSSEDGKELEGHIILPSNSVDGKRYPAVLWPYPGARSSDLLHPYYTTINSGFPLNLQVLASQGYAVIIPSIPLRPEGNKDDPLASLSRNAVPAVDEAARQGWIDGNDVFLLGHSGGGYAVYGLITMSDRFRAAVVMAGPSDLISLYGEFDPSKRYTDNPHEDFFMPALLEQGIFRMGAPPWDERDRYLRNSPLTFVEKVQTPLLILHGDRDYVSMIQAEQFFRALQRQGKEARFVRYWGEGHVISGRRNVENMWAEILGWFTSHQAKGRNTPQTSGHITSSP